MFKATHLAGFGGRRDIIRKNLQLWLDFQNPNCFDGVGSTQTINDLSPNAYALHRGDTTGAEATDPTFTAGLPACFQFDGGDKISHTNAYFGSVLRTTFRQDNDRTIEAWIRRSGTANTDEILFNCNASGAQPGGTVYLDYTANTVRIGGDPSSAFIDLGNQVPVGVWQHLALVFRPNGSTICRIYQNATQTGTGTFNNSGWTTGDSQNVASIGSGPPLSSPLQAGTQLAIFRIYDRILGADEIAQNFAVERGRFGI
jgi:hypothetical protein